MKKSLLKNFSFLLLLFIFPFNSIAQTNVSGFISANTTWNLAGSPYIVIGNALLSHGYTLTIEPGVVVKFETDKALQIDGELIAIGTAQSRITFTSNQAIPAAGDWAKIHFPDTCVDAVFDSLGNYLSGSIMKYCDVSYGGGLGFGEIHIDASSPYFSHCNIMYSSSDGIHSVSTTFLVDSSSIKNCTGYGLSFWSFFSHQNTVLVVQNDSLLNNSGGGLFLAPTSYSCPTCSVIIRRNNFSLNTQGGAINNNGGLISNEIITENYFVNNSSSLCCATVAISGINYIVECNHFLSNQVNGYAALRIDDFASNAAYIRNNFFYGNSPSSVFYVNCNYNSSTQHIYFINNLIENNSTPNGSTCFFEGYPIANNTGFFYISNNQFRNNQATNTIELFTATNQNNNTLRYAYIKNNNFINPGVQYEIKNALPYGDPNIYADSNYWGGSSTQHIDSVIYDYFDFANQTVVYYIPILNSPVYIDSTCKPFTTSIFENVQSNFSSIVFPNPFSQQATIRLDKEIRNATLRLYNVFGQVVKSSQHLFGKEISLSRENLNAGIYFYEVSEEQNKICQGKVVVY